MGKKLIIAGGLIVAALGTTAIVAHADRGDRYDRGGHHGSEYGGHYGGMYKEGREGRRRGRWRRDVTREDYDARTRSRFAKMDANGDGVVERSEVENRITRRMERRWSRRDRGGRRIANMLRRFDENGDGKVTKTEVDAHIAERFQKIDLTRDGQITDADLPPMMRGREFLSSKAERPRGWRRHHRQHGRKGRGMRRMMRGLYGADTNGDGAVTPEEFQTRAMRRFARFDRNGDGALDQSDRDALRKEVTDYRVSRLLHRYGADGDGRLTLEQFKAERDKRFARRDRDGDGVIERAERRGWKGRWNRQDRDGGRGRGPRDERGADRTERGNATER